MGLPERPSHFSSHCCCWRNAVQPLGLRLCGDGVGGKAGAHAPLGIIPAWHAAASGLPESTNSLRRRPLHVLPALCRMGSGVVDSCSFVRNHRSLIAAAAEPSGSWLTRCVARSWMSSATRSSMAFAGISKTRTICGKMSGTCEFGQDCGTPMRWTPPKGCKRPLHCSNVEFYCQDATSGSAR